LASVDFVNDGTGDQNADASDGLASKCEKLFPVRGAHLPSVHPAASYRRLGASSASDVRSDAAE
jgi:hypothetical protein